METDAHQSVCLPAPPPHCLPMRFLPSAWRASSDPRGKTNNHHVRPGAVEGTYRFLTQRHTHMKTFDCRLITYSAIETPADISACSVCVYVLVPLQLPLLLKQERSEGSVDRLQVRRERWMNRRRDRQSWAGEKNVHSPNEDIPAGEMLEGERQTTSATSNSRGKREKGELWGENRGG